MKSPKSTAETSPNALRADDAAMSLPGAEDSASETSSTGEERSPQAPAADEGQTDHDNTAPLPDDRLLVSVPNFGETMTDEEHEEWAKAVIAGRELTEHFGGQKRKASRQTFAMAFLSHIARPPAYFRAKLKDLGIKVPNSNSPFASAMAFYFKLDVGHADPKERANNSKALNRYTNAAMQLQSLVSRQPHDPSKIAVEYTPEGVLALLDVIELQGGINAMEQAFRDNDNSEPRLAVDSQRLEEQIIEQGRRYLEKQAGEARPVFGVGYVGGGENRFGFELQLTPRMQAEVYSKLPIGLPQVRVLTEIVCLGKAIADEKTTIPIKRGSDPSNPATPKRPASRMYVLHPEGQMTVSNILQDSGTIIEVRPKEDLLGFPVQGHVVFRPEARNEMEVLLSQPLLPLVVKYEIASAEGTQGVGRINLSSDALRDPSQTRVSILLQRVSGELPLVVDKTSFDPRSKGVVGTNAWMRLVNEYPAKLRTLKRPDISFVHIGLHEKGITVSDDLSFHKLDAAVDVVGTVKVRLDDIMRFLEAAAKVQPVGDIAVSLDAKMVAFAFDTEVGSYAVYIPAANAAPGTPSQRSDKHTIKLKPVIWPQQNAAE